MGLPAKSASVCSDPPPVRAAITDGPIRSGQTQGHPSGSRAFLRTSPLFFAVGRKGTRRPYEPLVRTSVTGDD
jgi:hypothetical protein